MAALSTIALVGGLALSAAGTVSQMQGSSAAAEASQRGVGAQQKVEALRYQAMEIDAQRKKREMVRQSIVTQGNNLATASAQGAQFSSGYQGAQAGVREQTGYNLLGVNQNLEIGRDIFSANKELLNSRIDESKAQTQVAIGGGLTTLGGSLSRNTAGIDRLAGWGSSSFGNSNWTGGAGGTGGGLGGLV